MTGVLVESPVERRVLPPRNHLWWVRTATAFLTLPLFAAAVIFCYWSGRTREVALWGDVNWAFGYSPVLLAPLAVSVGAWAATRTRWDKTVDLFDSTRTSRRLEAARTVTANWLLCCAGILTGLLACAARPLSVGGWGSVDLLLGLTVFAGIWASIAVGYLFGWFVPHWLTVAAAAVVVYMAQGMLLGTAWQWLFPMTEATRMFAAWPAQLSFARIVWFALAGTACLLLVGARSIKALVGAAIALGAASLVGIQLHGSQVGPGDEIRADVCSGAHPRVCVHPAFAPVVEEIASKVSVVLAPVADAGHLPAVVRQSVLSPGLDERSGVLTFNLMAVDGRVLDSAALASIGLGVLDMPGTLACADLPPDKSEAGARARNRVAAAMMQQSDQPTERRHAQLVTAFSEHWEDLRACTASVAELRGS